MPCGDCRQLLTILPGETELFCPSCDTTTEHSIESQALINAKTNWLLKDYFTDENLIEIVDQYRKEDLILFAVTHLNLRANAFRGHPKSGFPSEDFAYLIKEIYRHDEFGNEELSDPYDPDNTFDELKEGYSRVIKRCRDSGEQFNICLEDREMTHEWSDFTSDYRFLESEFKLCYDRCVRSIVGGDLDNYDDFTFVQDVLRSVKKTDVNDVESLMEFGDAWFQLIIGLRLLASTDEIVDSVYKTRLSDVTVFELGEFLSKLDGQFSQYQHKINRMSGKAMYLKSADVDRCGESVFGSDWDQVREQLIVSEENLDAHPFLFELEVELSKPVGRNKYRRTTERLVFYPRPFAELLKFQIFPLLTNGDEQDSGHKILKRQLQRRGEIYERNLYDYLTGKGIEVYHFAKLTEKHSNEIDLLVMMDDSVIFIELKHMLPPPAINSKDGIRVLDEKFDLRIFNIESENSDEKASGRPFPEIVDEWVSQDAGTRFSHQATPNQRDHDQFPENWKELEKRMYVVSNVVPSYIEKQDVRFLTDLEFYQLIEHDEDVLYTLPSMREDVDKRQLFT